MPLTSAGSPSGKHPCAKCAQAHYNLGAILEAQSKFEAAIARYQDAVRLNPKELYRNAQDVCEGRLAGVQSLAGE